MKKHSLLIPLAILLAACGGSGPDQAGAGTQQTAAPATPMDSFVSSVTTVVGASSDTTEPSANDASPAASPEDTEPSPIS